MFVRNYFKGNGAERWSDWQQFAGEGSHATSATNAENANIIKPNETKTIIINTGENNGKTALTLENGKTYMFSVLRYSTWIYSVTFVLHVPEENRVRTFEDRYDLINEVEYCATSNIIALLNKFVRFVYNHSRKHIYIESWNFSNNTWEFYGDTKPILEVMYHEIATI
jgi:hypothetical protein